jgi:hypothetical protein
VCLQGVAWDVMSDSIASVPCGWQVTASRTFESDRVQSENPDRTAEQALSHAGVQRLRSTECRGACGSSIGTLSLASKQCSF